MEFLALTKVGGIFAPFAYIIGFILDWVYKFLDWINIGNVGLAIILLTIIINMLMLPMTIRQQKFTRVNAAMTPEINKIREKYRGKVDRESQAQMQAEMNKIYEKYGTSATGGCLQLVIQLPILMALYSVIRNIPAYIEPIGNMYKNIADPIAKADPSGTVCAKIIKDLGLNVVVEKGNVNTVIDMLSAMRIGDLQTIGSTYFPSVASVGSAISANFASIQSANSFLGLSLSDYPTTGGWWPGVLIPVLSGITQFINTKVSTPNNNNAAGGAGMKVMMFMMPLISVFICFSLQNGVGLYWIARAVVLTICIVIINKKINKKGIDALVAESKEKADKKREKRGGKRGAFEQYANVSTKNIDEPVKRKTISDIARSNAALIEDKKDAKPAAKEVKAEVKAEAKSEQPADTKPSKASKSSKGTSSTGRSISDIAKMFEKK